MLTSIPAEEDRWKLLHFAIVGGGPTGIEFAAELHDLIHEDLRNIYPDLLQYVQITVYDVAPKILPMFDQALASYAMGMFTRQNIHVKTGHHIQRVRPDPDGSGGLKLKIQEHGDDEVGAGIVVWSTGLMQNPLIERLAQKTVAVPGSEAQAQTPGGFKLEKDCRTGSIVVDGRLRARLVDSAAAAADSAAEKPEAGALVAEGGAGARVLEDVFVIGDCSTIDGQVLPKTAQVASQEAAYLSRSLNGFNPEGKPFAFHNLGSMTYLGNWKALWQKDNSDLTGRAAWLLWRTAYLTRSMSIKNKVLIPFYVSAFVPSSSPCLIVKLIECPVVAGVLDLWKRYFPLLKMYLGSAR